MAPKRSRVKPDYEVSVGDLQKVLEVWMIQRNSRDIWKLFKVIRLAVEQGFLKRNVHVHIFVRLINVDLNLKLKPLFPPPTPLPHDCLEHIT
jgi:hypothetical protein